MPREPYLLDPKVEEEGAKAVYDALTDEERKYLADDDMCLRHFRAEKGNLKHAIKKIKETLKWRKEFEVDRIVDCFFGEEGQGGDEEMQEVLLEENATGKIYVRGYDCDGRATIYMRPSRENTKNETNQMRHLVFALERAIACTERRSDGLEKINLMIDYDGYRMKHMPPVSTTKHTLTILQGHYPERLHKAYVCNPPFAFRAFWTFVKPFLDPVTKEKIVFCHGKHGVEEVQKRYDLDYVESCAGGVDGKYCRPFDSAEYLKDTPFDRAFGEDDVVEDEEKEDEEKTQRTTAPSESSM